MKKSLSVFTMIIFSWLFSYTANAWVFEQTGPSVDAYFTGDISIKKVYKWGTGLYPSRKVFDHIAPAEMTAEASSTYKTKGRGVSGASIKATVTDVSQGIPFRAFEQDVGPFIGSKAEANRQNWVETVASNSVSITVSTPKTINIDATGTGAAAKFVGGGGMGITMTSGGGASVSYSDGTSITMSAPSGTKRASWTLTYTEELPDGAFCTSPNGCNRFLPNADYHKVDCPHKIPRAFNRGQKDCPGYTWACQSDSVCEHEDDHLEPCVGGCGDLLHSSRKHIHREECTPVSGEPVGSYGAGNHYYYDCTQAARDAHKRINGQCGHRYRNCVKGDHDQRYTSCPVSITQNGQTVYCNAPTPGWKCEHTHNFSSGSSSTDNPSSTSNADETVETKTCTRRVPKRVRRRINGRWRWVTRMLPCGESFTDDDNDYGDCVPGKKHRE